MKIIELSSENIKRLKAVRITPDRNLMVIGGLNANGKTSVLDSIFYALGGNAALPDRPVREGAKKGKVEIDLGDFTVCASFTDKGKTLKVETKDGLSYPSPQTMLNKLVGKLSFDPLDFSRMDGKKQLEVVREFMGLDFSKHDADRKALYDERTQVNRRHTEIKGQIAAMETFDDAPSEEVSIADLSAQLSNATKQQDALRNTIYRMQEFESLVERKIEKIQILQEQISSTQVEIDALIEDSKKLSEIIADSKEKAINPAPIQEAIMTAEDTNRKVRANQERERVRKELRKWAGKADELTEQIESMDDAKREKISKTPFPIEGMGFDENGITFKELPFEQASGSEQLRMSVAMGMALNPKLKVLLIRDGSLLDDTNLELLAEMAEANDCQVWLEKVTGKADECTVLIEDGEVKNGSN